MSRDFHYKEDVLLKKSESGEIEIHFATEKKKEDLINRLEETLEFLKRNDLDRCGVSKKYYDLDGELAMIGIGGKSKYYKKAR